MAKKKSGVGFWICVAVGVAFAINGIAGDDEPASKEFDEPVITVVQGETPDSDDTTVYGGMYDQLSSEEQKLYSVIEDTIAKGSLQAEAKGIRVGDDDITEFINNAVRGVYADRPDFFWMDNGNWSANYYYTNTSGVYDITVSVDCCEYWNYVSNPNSYINAVMTKAKEIANKASTQATTYDKIKYVHDYLVTNVVYDDECLERLNQSNIPASCQQSHTVYGALVNNLAVCDGYSKTMQLIMDMLGIGCEFMTGDAGGPHAWNYMILDGETYWMDVTWDDSNITDDYGKMKYPNGVEYSYFCVTSDQFTRTHTPEPSADFAVPSCTATKYNYFNVEGLFLDSYSFDSYYSAISRVKDQQIISVQFPGILELQKAANDLFEVNGKWSDVSFLNKNGISYFVDENNYVVSIYNK